MHGNDRHHYKGTMQTQNYDYILKRHVPYSNFSVFEKRIIGDHNGTRIPGIKYVEILPDGYTIHITEKNYDCVLNVPYYLFPGKKRIRDFSDKNIKKMAISISSDESGTEILVRDFKKFKEVVTATLDREKEKSGSHGLVEASL